MQLIRRLIFHPLLLLALHFLLYCRQTASFELRVDIPNYSKLANLTRYFPALLYKRDPHEKEKEDAGGSPGKGRIPLCTRQEYIESHRCPEQGWSFVYGTCVYISLLNDRTSWSESREVCKSVGADLIIIPNKEYHRAFLNLSAIPKNFNHWIGLSSLAEHGTYTWVNGSLEENQSFGGKDGCVRISHEGWSSEDCSDIRGFICQRLPIKREKLPYALYMWAEEEADLESSHRVTCFPDLRYDHVPCIYWEWANQTGQGFVKAACGNQKKHSELITNNQYDPLYFRRTLNGKCEISALHFIDFFVDFKEIFDGMKIKCCRDGYNDSWLGYQEAICSDVSTIKVQSDGDIIRPKISTSEEGNTPLAPFVGQLRSWDCHGKTSKGQVMSVGFADQNRTLKWLSVVNLKKQTRTYGTPPSGLFREPVFVNPQLRVIVVQYRVRFAWEHNLGYFVCWMRNVSQKIGTRISKSDRTSVWSYQINMHYPPGKPKLTLSELSGLKLTATCVGAVGNYDNSCLMWGLYVSNAYYEFFTIDLNKTEHNKKDNSNFRIKSVVVSNSTTFGPTIESTVEIQLPKFITKGTVLCLSYRRAPANALKQKYDNDSFSTFYNISIPESVKDTRAVNLVGVRILVASFLFSLCLEITTLLCQQSLGELQQPTEE